VSEQRQRASEGFWQLPLTPSLARSAAEKYRALGAIAHARDQESRRSLMRTISKRWPGALREAELLHPDLVAERGRRSESMTGGAGDPLSFGAAAAKGEAGWLLWSELHARLRDLAHCRSESGGALADWQYRDWVAGMHGESAQRWPRADLETGLEGVARGVRLAYLSLAWCCGLSLPSLNALLVGRSGHWDRRAGDPKWAHEEGPCSSWPGLSLAQLG
jgi:hypothetical protein